MKHLALPSWFWSILIVLNVFVFVVGISVTDRKLMATALFSGLSCYCVLKLNGEKNEK